MGVKERRDRERATTRQLILDTARTLLVQNGYDALTMRGLAERIEYSPTAIYAHFADKEALLTELSVCDFQEFSARMAHAVSPVATPHDRLCFLGRAYIQFAEEHPSQYRHLFLTEREVTAEAQARKPSEDAYDILLAGVDACIRAGDIHPSWAGRPHHVAQTYWSSLHGIVALHMTMPTKIGLPKVDTAELAETAMAMLMRGFALPAPGS